MPRRRDPRTELAALQRRQLGAFHRRQAIGLGVSAATVDGRLRNGRYRRLLPGVIAEQGTPDSWELRALAATLWAGEDAVLTCRAAAGAYGWRDAASGPAGLHVAVVGRRLRPPSGIRVHLAPSVASLDRRMVGALPVTGPARTCTDLAGELAPGELRDVVAAAARDGLTGADLRAALRARGRIRGATALRRIAAELSPLDEQCRSPLEAEYLRFARSHGLEPTAMNHPVRDARGRRRHLDAVYLPEHVWVEVDGARWHSTRLDVADDEARSEDVALAGPWPAPIRLRSADLCAAASAATAERIRHALRAASRPWA